MVLGVLEFSAPIPRSPRRRPLASAASVVAVLPADRLVDGRGHPVRVASLVRKPPPGDGHARGRRRGADPADPSPRAGLLWSVPVFAPLRGRAPGPAYVGMARSQRRPGSRRPRGPRLGLARAGRGPHGRDVLVRSRTARSGGRTGGVVRAPASDALGPLLSGPSLSPAAVWAGLRGAAALVVRGRWLSMVEPSRQPPRGRPALSRRSAALGDKLADPQPRRAGLGRRRRARSAPV